MSVRALIQFGDRHRTAIVLTPRDDLVVAQAAVTPYGQRAYGWTTDLLDILLPELAATEDRTAGPAAAEGRRHRGHASEAWSLLEVLVAHDPIVNDDDDIRHLCLYCGVVAYHVWDEQQGQQRSPVVHEADCPWARARALVAGS